MGHQRKIDDSDIKSARAHPQLQDIEFVENSLLASNVDYDEQGQWLIHHTLIYIIGICIISLYLNKGLYECDVPSPFFNCSV